ncbi:adenylosuccinate synthase [Xenorhabdus szentirmaii]|uniref:Adenylosuccinate synthetase n=1 Tax=Xenorhabdus szentirmaii DSM 16338 TaxID=1427518 RepID=W1ITJ1_9GAMM|nr:MULTISPECIES: adenylosuccinate synthase [Xenorhabdus]MBD2781417.1 adenylosuccinate synthase [Xenorhabdus sp. 38]MBD2791509.1 adenylosuccinate synthase [Xenorhabdus sp. CUL]MBD2821808.1 adenylosuccinate synthase [Xenorhabdus sp. 42]MBD2824663.1 adenylosuccinate synthase [Xenorhabdus sp. 5]PHM32601.1 adenylosuccinate synthetase [Xenorhabdus szentirmaii DSM 16338]
MLKAVVGLQFGDEGKGKFVDYLSGNINNIARFNGGANAGHCVQYGNVRGSFSQLPASLNKKNLYICQGALISLPVLVKEIDFIKNENINSSIFIDPRCHVVLPLHAELNKASEKYKGKNKIGSVGVGVGACVEDKSNRHGIRLIDTLDKEKLRSKLAFLWGIREKQINYVFNEQVKLDFEEMLETTHQYGKRIEPYFTFTNEAIGNLLDHGDDILLETSQATFLDNSFGTYPYTVAYQTLVQTCFAMIGIPAQKMHIVGVMKAYMIRVGNGPFPTELQTEQADYIRERGNEYGTVSKRPRRCGWLDLCLIKHAVRLNGVTEIAITNVDVLAGIDEIKVAIAYEIDGEIIGSDKALLQLDKVKPIYKTFKCWGELKESYENLAELPCELVDFLNYIQEYAGVPIKYISHGPDRAQTLIA